MTAERLQIEYDLLTEARNALTQHQLSRREENPCPVCERLSNDVTRHEIIVADAEKHYALEKEHEYRNGGPDWKKQTCKDCHFRVGDECRRFPPQETVQTYAYEDSTSGIAYPDVEFADEEAAGKVYMDACAEWKRGKDA